MKEQKQESRDMAAATVRETKRVTDAQDAYNAEAARVRAGVAHDLTTVDERNFLQRWWDYIKRRL